MKDTFVIPSQSRQGRRTESEAWLLDHVYANCLESFTEKDEETSQFCRSFWPFLEPYFSPLNPVFAFEGLKPAFLGQRKTWMLRDGAMPLSWFFRMPPPEGSASFLVHESLRHLIPESWAGRVKLYRTYAESTFDKSRPPKALFLAGPVNSRICGLQELDTALDRLEGSIDPTVLRKLEVRVHCPVRSSVHIPSSHEQYEFDFYQRLFSRFGSRLRSVQWRSIDSMSFDGVLYLELNSRWIYADSSVEQTVLSRGAGLLAPDRQPRTPSYERIPLSDRHGVEIIDPTLSPWPIDTEGLKAFYMRLGEYFNEGPNDRTPWPAWFSRWSGAVTRSMMKPEGTRLGPRERQ